MAVIKIDPVYPYVNPVDVNVLLSPACFDAMKAAGSAGGPHRVLIAVVYANIPQVQIPRE